jgi:hypothetical protein
MRERNTVGVGLRVWIRSFPYLKHQANHRSQSDTSHFRAFYIFSIITNGKHSKAIVRNDPTDLPLLSETPFKCTIFAYVARHVTVRTHSTLEPCRELPILPLPAAALTPTRARPNPLPLSFLPPPARHCRRHCPLPPSSVAPPPEAPPVGNHGTPV